MGPNPQVHLGACHRLPTHAGASMALAGEVVPLMRALSRSMSAAYSVGDIALRAASPMPGGEAGCAVVVGCNGAGGVFVCSVCCCNVVCSMPSSKGASADPSRTHDSSSARSYNHSSLSSPQQACAMEAAAANTKHSSPRSPPSCTKADRWPARGRVMQNCGPWK